MKEKDYFQYTGHLVDHSGVSCVPNWAFSAFKAHELFYDPFGQLHVKSAKGEKYDKRVGIGDFVRNIRDKNGDFVVHTKAELLYYWCDV